MEEVVFENLPKYARNNLLHATFAFLDRCFTDPAFPAELERYKAKLIREGRWPLPDTDGTISNTDP